MSLSLTLASSCSLLSSLLLVAPAFADEPPPPAAPPALAPAPAMAPPAYVVPDYSMPPGPGPGMYGPPVYGPYGPYAQQPTMLETHRASPGLIVGGSVLAFAGLGATVGGAFVYLIETGVVCDGSGGGSCGGSGASGIALVVGGSLAMIGGVTMIVLGARKVPASGSEATLQLRPTGADLRVTF